VQIATGRGSTIWHSPVEARQALAIERALGVKDLLDFAGQVLWAASFDVDDRYWRPRLLEMDDFVRRTLAQARDIPARDIPGEEGDHGHQPERHPSGSTPS
jgi:hypothetical protein